MSQARDDADATVIPNSKRRDVDLLAGNRAFSLTEKQAKQVHEQLGMWLEEYADESREVTDY